MSFRRAVRELEAFEFHVKFHGSFEVLVEGLLDLLGVGRGVGDVRQVVGEHLYVEHVSNSILVQLCEAKWKSMIKVKHLLDVRLGGESNEPCVSISLF